MDFVMYANFVFILLFDINIQEFIYLTGTPNLTFLEDNFGGL